MSFHPSLVPTFTPRISPCTEAQRLVSSAYLRGRLVPHFLRGNVFGVWEAAWQELQESAKKGSSGSASHPWRDSAAPPGDSG